MLVTHLVYDACCNIHNRPTASQLRILVTCHVSTGYRTVDTYGSWAERPNKNNRLTDTASCVLYLSASETGVSNKVSLSCR
jgi:hypothetical protein